MIGVTTQLVYGNVTCTLRSVIPQNTVKYWICLILLAHLKPCIRCLDPPLYLVAPIYDWMVVNPEAIHNILGDCFFTANILQHMSIIYINVLLEHGAFSPPWYANRTFPTIIVCSLVYPCSIQLEVRDPVKLVASDQVLHRVSKQHPPSEPSILAILQSLALFVNWLIQWPELSQTAAWTNQSMWTNPAMSKKISLFSFKTQYILKWSCNNSIWHMLIKILFLLSKIYCTN